MSAVAKYDFALVDLQEYCDEIMGDDSLTPRFFVDAINSVLVRTDPDKEESWPKILKTHH